MYKNRNRKGFIEVLGAFACLLIFLGILVAVSKVESREKDKKNKIINEQPITEIDGQKFRIYKDHLYPVVKINGKEETIIKENE